MKYIQIHSYVIVAHNSVLTKKKISKSGFNVKNTKHARGLN